MHSNATGIDGINLKMIKIVFPFCADVLVNIINESFSTGVFPAIWKESLILPRSKASQARSYTELRPIIS